MRYTLPLHDALPISICPSKTGGFQPSDAGQAAAARRSRVAMAAAAAARGAGQPPAPKPSHSATKAQAASTGMSGDRKSTRLNSSHRCKSYAVFCLKKKMAKKYNLRIGTFGHMGDGNLHPTFLTDERDKEEMRRVEEAFKEIFDEAIRLGGTITGDHGVGLAKKSFLPKFAGDAQMRVMRELRRALDPRGILNPGKMFFFRFGPATPIIYTLSLPDALPI